MLDLAPEGFEEQTVAGGGLELAAYTNAAGEAAIRAVFAAVTSTPVADDWAERWRAFHQPVELGSLWIGPPWREPAPGRIPIVIDPGRAFGTGAHDTTRLCLEQLEALPRGSLLDVGCGSGVLAIGAARLGYAPVTALDNDPNAVEATAENAARNGVEVAVAQLDVLVGELPSASVAVANVSLAVVAAVLPRLRAEWAVVSGFRAEDELDTRGWNRAARADRGGWAVEVLHRPTG
jgi:ribosomal protein L11 methyltransferase